MASRAKLQINSLIKSSLYSAEGSVGWAGDTMRQVLVSAHTSKHGMRSQSPLECVHEREILHTF